MGTAVAPGSQVIRIDPVTTHAGAAAPCGKSGNPKCGDAKARAASRSPLVKKIDELALTFGSKLSKLDPHGKMTILESTEATDAKQRLEHTAGIIIGGNDAPRFTKMNVGDLDSSKVAWENETLKEGDRVVGTIHSHPGGGGAEHFSAGDIDAAKTFNKQNKGALDKKVGTLFYILTPKSDGGRVLVFDVERNTITEVK